MPPNVDDPKLSRVETAAIAYHPQLEAAFHEAGHAVVCIQLGVPFASVTIVADRDSFGGVDSPTPSPLETKRQIRSRVRRQIVAGYAGIEAQRLIDRSAPLKHAGSDLKKIGRWSGQVGPRGRYQVGDERHRAYLAQLRAESRRLVQRLKRPILHLARALLVQKTLSRAEAAAAIAHLMSPKEGEHGS